MVFNNIKTGLCLTVYTYKTGESGANCADHFVEALKLIVKLFCLFCLLFSYPEIE